MDGGARRELWSGRTAYGSCFRKAGDPHISGWIYQLVSPAVPADHMPAGSDRWVVRKSTKSFIRPATSRALKPLRTSFRSQLLTYVLPVCSTAGSVEMATKCSFLSVRDPGDRSPVQPVGMRDGTVLGRTASTCGRAAVQSFRHGARALNLEACPELRMDTVQPIEDDAASEATRPTSKPGGCEESVPS